jgi:hypothetical protein
MTTVDSLKILIEADASQIEGVLKRALTTVTGAVGNMNKQEVDWTSIFTRAVSPALIAGVASTFAMALEQFTSFNNAAMNLNNVATPATADFSAGIGKMSGDIYKLASTAGVGLGDAATSYYAFTKAGLDNAAAQYAVIEAAGIARDTNVSLSEATKQLSDLFEKWGVETTPQVTEALTGLANAASQGKFTFSELVSTISAEGENLAGKTHIGDVAISLAALSDKTKLTKHTIVEEFSAIASGVADPLAKINLLVGNMSTDITSGPNGLITAFSHIKDRLAEYGPTIATTMGRDIGLSAKTVADNMGSVKKEFKEASDKGADLHAHLVPLNEILAKNEPISAQVAANFERFKVAIASMVLPPLSAWLKTTADGFQGLQTVLASMSEFMKNSGFTAWLKDVVTPINALNDALGKGASTWSNLTTGAPIEAVYNALSSGGTNVQDTKALEAINSKLLGAGATPQAINKIDQTAQSSGLTAQLLHALSSGMSAGGTSNTQLNNTFHLTVPTGSQQFTADMIAKQLYQNFQGSK